ncbi:nucleoside-diphosphate-sugar epimerase [Caldalkalibacillus uzonensis]|uniref:Nucleoside-diphosphate-sugar epimerase n=1 Tax=Caldalkalibacillus uzonensis TaxID=353224 RepID=A0ABU0CR08_9BACI|nr:NAD-dependent epimerase/dehydratase family protein [Caldalkalibacillus uzonensis]MDQ0338856.1 nucleoside-diphosphate-sugar epimerase [Caldalkalibacillus uzonensis]
MTGEKGKTNLVLGTGPLGMSVMERLLLEGQQVMMVNQSGQADVPEQVQVIKCDLVKETIPLEIIKKVDVVYHCIGLPYPQWGKLKTIMNNVIQALRNSDTILVYADNLYAYGPSHGKLVETLLYRPVGKKTRIRADIATFVIEEHNKGNIRAAIGRGSDFYGPRVRNSALGYRVFEHLLKDKSVDIFGNIDTPHTYIYIHDFAAGLVTLGTRTESLGEIWHIPSAETMTTRAMIEKICQELGNSPSYRIANRLILHALGLFNQEMRELKEIYYQFERPFVVNHNKYKTRFGEQVTPHEQAVRETIKWYRDQNSKNKIS